MERTCSRLRFLVRNEQDSDTDMHVPPLVHVRTLFFFFLSLLSLPRSPLLSSSLLSLPSGLFLCLLSLFLSSFSRSLSVCLRVMVLCLVFVLGKEEGTVCTFKTPSVSRHKTSPCVLAPLAHVFRQVRVVPVHTGTF